MTSIFKFELKRAFINRSFVIALLIGCLISILQIIDFPLNYAFDMQLMINSYPQSVFNSYIGLSIFSVWTFVFYMIFPLLASLPYADSYLSDIKNGYVKQIFTRVSKVKLLFAKLVSVFVSGGTVVVIPLLLNLFLTQLCVPSVIPDASTGMFPIFGNAFLSELYYSNPFGYILIFDLIIFITAGVLSCTALAFSYIVKYKYIVLIIPFLLFMVISFGAEMIGNNSLNISEWIIPTQLSQPLNLPIVIAELTVIFAATCIIYFYKGLKNDTI